MVTRSEHLLDNIAANRAARKYSWAIQCRRVVWMFGCWLIRLSPRPAFAWRRAVLRLFGAAIGKHVHVYPSTKLYMPWNVTIDDWSALGDDVFVYSLGRVDIGAGVTISYRAHICAGAHDLDDPLLPLTKPSIKIADGAWVGTEAFIGPGVNIGYSAVIGARAVVVSDVVASSKVAGNPARVIGQRKIIMREQR